MAYPYGTQGAPVVGNGLGGLPRRAVAAAAAATSQPVYTFSQYAAKETNTSLTNYGQCLYFGDSNIYWVMYGSDNGLKVTFDRVTGTITATQQSIVPAAGYISPAIFDINISSTFICSSSTGRTATRSGDTITLGWIVPQSGTLTIGGAAYSVSDFTVRAMLDGSGYVAYSKDSSATSYLNVWVFDSALTLLRSFRFDATQTIGANWFPMNAVINRRGTFIICNRDGAAGATETYNSYAVNLSSGSVLAMASFSASGQGDTITSRALVATYFDYATNTFTVQSRLVVSSLHIPYGYSVTYNDDTAVFTHFDGQTGINKNRNIGVGSAYSIIYFGSANQIYAAVLGATNIGVASYSKYGIPYSNYAANMTGSYAMKLPLVAPSISDLPGFNITKPKKDTGGYGNTIPALCIQASGDYQNTFSTPGYGYISNIGTYGIYIGDDLFLTMQQRSDSIGYVGTTVLKRTVTQS